MNQRHAEITEKSKIDLCQAALAVRKNAYSIYSKFSVGAAIVDTKGQIFVGCNIENASFGLTVCAERVAIFNAISSGSCKFNAIAVATSGGHFPCGACRQVMAEFQDDLKILICDVDAPEAVREISLNDLLPGKFSLE